MRPTEHDVMQMKEIATFLAQRDFSTDEICDLLQSHYSDHSFYWGGIARPIGSYSYIDLMFDEHGVTTKEQIYIHSN